MSKQIIQKVDSKDIKGSSLKVLLEYKNNLLLYSNGEILFHDEEGYDVINKSFNSKRKRTFKGIDFNINEKSIFNSKKSVNQIIDFNRFYYMMSDNHSSSLFAIKDNDEALLIKDMLLVSDYKRRYMNREELEAFLNKDNQLLRYGSVWTNSIEIPTGQEILNSFKEYVMEEYVRNQSDEEAKTILTSLVNNACEEAITRNYQILPEEILLINTNDNNLSVSNIIIKYEGKDWFKVEIKSFPITKYTLSQIKDLTLENGITKEKQKLEIRPIFKKNKELGKRFIKSI